MNKINIGLDGRCTFGTEVDDAYVVYCCKCGKPIEPEYEDCICIDEDEEVYVCWECHEESQENGHVDLM